MRRPTRQLITTAILLAAVLAGAAPAAAQATAYAPTYLDPIDLGTLGGNDTRAYDAHGARIVGASQTVDGTVHAFTYENGVMTDLGTLGGSTSWAFAVNAAGAVVGSASLPGDVAAHAFLWTEDAGMLDLGTLGGTSSRASGINDAGQVSGWSQVAGDRSYHAFLWDPTTGMRDLGTFGGNTSFAYDVGAIACGEAETTDGSRHAFVTSNDGLTDLGTLGGNYSAAINCSGRVLVGESSVSDDRATHAVSWNSLLRITDLGTLGGTESRALRVSLPGEIFGESRTVEGDLHPVRWGRIADFAYVLGADSRIESVVPVRWDYDKRVISGAASPGADVHTYIVSVPSVSDPSPPIRTIDDGVLEALGSSRIHFTFNAEDTSADVSMSESGGLLVCFLGRPQCAAGDRISLSATRLSTNDGRGPATVRGNQYSFVAMPQVQLTITAGSFIVPDSGEQWFTASMPFTFSGFLLGTSRNYWEGQPDKLFGFSLRGAGTVTIRLFSCDTCILPDGRRSYTQTELKYVFERP